MCVFIITGEPRLRFCYNLVGELGKPLEFSGLVISKSVNRGRYRIYMRGVLDYFRYSESQIYEYIARVFYNVVFSTYLGSNAAEKRV